MASFRVRALSLRMQAFRYPTSGVDKTRQLQWKALRVLANFVVQQLELVAEMCRDRQLNCPEVFRTHGTGPCALSEEFCVEISRRGQTWSYVILGMWHYRLFAVATVNGRSVREQ